MVNTFGQLALEHGNEIPPWLHRLDASVPVEVIKLESGGLIEDSNGGGQKLDGRFSLRLGIVLEGRAELFDFVPTAFSTLCYRPIRILGPGDLFGEFKILDATSDVLANDGFASFSYAAAESWQLRAGYQCVIPLMRWPDQSRWELSNLWKKGFLTRCGRYEEYRDCHYLHAPSVWENLGARLKKSLEYVANEGAKVAYIALNLDLIKRDPVLELGLFRSGWIKADAYRKCVNSFNWDAVHEFRHMALKQTITRKDQCRSPLDKFPQKKDLIGIVADALLDAINRPVRDEPCYVEFAEPEGERTGVLVADNKFTEKFSFPVDVHNYSIALGLHKLFDGRPPSLGKIPDEYRRAFSTDENRVNIYRVARVLTDLFAQSNKNYPYSLKVRKCASRPRDIILLDFLHADLPA